MINRVKQNVCEYIGNKDGKFFSVPSYQRGYRWGDKGGDEASSVEYLLDNLFLSFLKKETEYFLQGVTVSVSGNQVVLVDGQQRTTTLFLILSRLFTDNEKRDFFFNGKDAELDNFKLDYKIREASKKFLFELCCKNGDVKVDRSSQDNYYMSTALKQIEEKLVAYRKRLEDEDRTLEGFKKYILDSVHLFFIDIGTERRPDFDVQTFSMLNRDKAQMLSSELIKAEELCQISNLSLSVESPRTVSETLELLRSQFSIDWQIDARRSMFARQWDRWLYWWNRYDVRSFFRVKDDQVGLTYLLDVYSRRNGRTPFNENDAATCFRKFKQDFIDQKKASVVFDELRHLQKQLEDIYSNVHTYNYCGMLLVILEENKRMDVINQFIKFIHNKDNDLQFRLKKYSRYCLLIGIETEQEDTGDGKKSDRIKHEDILKAINNDENALRKIRKAAEQVRGILRGPKVYTEVDSESKELAFKHLFRLNVEASDEQGVKFEFFYSDAPGGQLKSFYENRSLEHVWPKSKVMHRDDKGDEYLIDEDGGRICSLEEKCFLLSDADFDQTFSEHCIGNLLFLHKTDNSKFGAKYPNEKKARYFSIGKVDGDANFFLSRNMLHTLSVYAEDWPAVAGDDGQFDWKERVCKRILDEKNRFDEKFTHDYALNVEE